MVIVISKPLKRHSKLSAEDQLVCERCIKADGLSKIEVRVHLPEGQRRRSCLWTTNWYLWHCDRHLQAPKELRYRIIIHSIKLLWTESVVLKAGTLLSHNPQTIVEHQSHGPDAVVTIRRLLVTAWAGIVRNILVFSHDLHVSLTKSTTTNWRLMTKFAMMTVTKKCRPNHIDTEIEGKISTMKAMIRKRSFGSAT